MPPLLLQKFRVRSRDPLKALSTNIQNGSGCCLPQLSIISSSKYFSLFCHSLYYFRLRRPSFISCIPLLYTHFFLFSLKCGMRRVSDNGNRRPSLRKSRGGVIKGDKMLPPTMMRKRGQSVLNTAQF